MRAPEPDDLIGLRVPGGTSRAESYENLLLHDAVRAPRSPRPHPIWAFLAPQRGMGMTLATLFETLGCPLDAGPLLGRFGVRWVGPFSLDADHRVRGGVTAVRRRRGRVLGVVDEVDVVLDLERADAAPVLTATYGFLLPRGDVPAPDAPPAARSVAPQPDGPQPDGPQPDGPQPDGPQPDGPQPDGPEIAGPPITVRAEEMKLLALLLRDPNPIHVDADVAVAQGHRGCVNQGPANLAYALTLLTARRPHRVLSAFDARFRATVVDGDRVVPVVREDGGDEPGAAFAVRRADGRDAVTGRAELRAAG